MSEQGNNNVDNTAQKGADTTKGLAKKGFSAVKKTAKVIITKVIGLSLFAVPGFLIILILISIFGVYFYFGMESRGADQEYEIEDKDAGNEYSEVVNEYGDPEIVSLSEENAFLQVFYENEVKDSYWKYYKDGDEDVLDFGANEEPFDDDVKDKYDREKYFQLHAMSLYALDENLNGNQYSTPQTFIQHVPFTVTDDNRIEGVDLTDKDGELSVESHAFKKDTDKEGDEGQAVYKRKYDKDNKPVMKPGVWDYGLAPVYNYEKFEEEVEVRNTISGGEIWDKENQKMRKMTAEELANFIADGLPGQYENWEESEEIEGKPKKADILKKIPKVEKKDSRTSYMIRDAATPMGTIKNDIEQVWRESGNNDAEQYTLTMSVPVEAEREVQATDKDGNKLWYEYTQKSRYERIDYRVPGLRRSLSANSRGASISSINHFPWGTTPSSYGFPELPKNKEEEREIASAIPSGWKVTYKRTPTDKQTTNNNGKDCEVKTTEKYFEWEEREHHVEVDSVEWEHIPRYKGQPDKEDLDAFGYYTDYFTNYENYVAEESIKKGPFTYLEKAREEEIEGVNEGEYAIPLTLEERRDGEIAKNKDGIVTAEHPFMQSIRDLQLEHLDSNDSSSSAIQNVDFGIESDSQAVQDASRFLPQFIEYGNRYGVDPMMLVALAAVETRGHHEPPAGAHGSFGVYRSYLYQGNGYSDRAAIGLMQILPPPGNTTKPRTTSAYNHETGQIDKFTVTQKDLHDVDNNIRFATMLFAEELKLADYDALVGIGGYHYGRKFTFFVQNNGYDSWSQEAADAYIAAGNNGDTSYIPQMLKYYLPTETDPFPWALDNKGNKVVQEVEGLDFAKGAPVNNDILESVGRKRQGANAFVQKSVDLLNSSKLLEVPYRALTKITGWIGDGAHKVSKWLNLSDDDIDTDDYYKVGTNKPKIEPVEILYTMLAYEEGMYLEHYADMDEEELIDTMIEAFMSSIKEQDNIGMGVNPLDFFPEGHQSPVDNVDIIGKFGADKGGKATNSITLAVPGSAKIRAVADGTIDEIGENYIIIDHGNGVTTHYRKVGTVKISDREIGDFVEKAEVIATGGEKDGQFEFALNNGKFVDPTWIVDPTVLTNNKTAVGEVLLHPSETNWMHPYTGADFRKTSPYGMRTHPDGTPQKWHNGTDYAGVGKYKAAQQPIRAVDNAIVAQAGWINGFGNAIVLRHDHLRRPNGDNVFTIYAHMVRPSKLSTGTTVTKGTIIGNEGNSGGSFGAHLHLELVVGPGTSWSAARNAGGVADEDKNTSDVDILLSY